MFARKILTSALVALTVAAGSLATAGSAEAHHMHHPHGGWGWGVGGFATGLVVGSVIASRPVYVEPVRRCFIEQRVDADGDVIGTRKVCRVVEE